jgi:hypothetical protein
MRARKPSKRVGVLVRTGNHTMMGIAIGLAFAFVSKRAEVFGIKALMEQSDAPATRLIDFAITCAIAFGVVATLTGMILTTDEHEL